MIIYLYKEVDTMNTVEIAYMKGIISEDQFEQIREFCLVEGKANTPKATGRPKRSVPDNFIDVYYQWAFDGITLNRAIQELKMAKGTFYRILNEEGLLKKDDVRIKHEVDKVLLGIDGNKLVVSNSMSVSEATSVIRQAINYVGPRLRCANQMQTFDECVCVDILKKWIETKQWDYMSHNELYRQVGIGKNTYHINKGKMKGEVYELYLKKIANSIRLI